MFYPAPPSIHYYERRSERPLTPYIYLNLIIFIVVKGGNISSQGEEDFLNWRRWVGGDVEYLGWGISWRGGGEIETVGWGIFIWEIKINRHKYRYTHTHTLKYKTNTNSHTHTHTHTHSTNSFIIYIL